GVDGGPRLGDAVRAGQWPGHDRRRDGRSPRARLIRHERTRRPVGWRGALCARPEARHHRDRASATRRHTTINQRTGMLRVLIVEDHEIMRRGLKEVFADAFPDLQVGEAENARSALACLTTQEWDIVLLDINIPGRSGLEVLEDVKRL